MLMEVASCLSVRLCKGSCGVALYFGFNSEEVYELVLAVYGEVTGMEAKFKRLMQELDTDGSGTVELGKR